MERINKLLSALGIASRRQVDRLISQNRIKVNGAPAVVGQKVSPRDTITLDDRPLPVSKQPHVYYLLNKPLGVLSTAKDDRGRPTVLDYVTSPFRLYPVGRLDYNSTGLIILTNDGDLALKLTHPRYHLPKTYLVTLNSPVSPGQISQLSGGVVLEDGKTLPAVVKIFHKTVSQTILKITLKQGKNRQIRRMCAALGLEVAALHRTAIGPIQLGNLPAGRSRPLTQSEIKMLKKL